MCFLSVALSYGFWLWTVCYLRLTQVRSTWATERRRFKDNPLKLAHIPDKGGYEFEFDNPRQRLHELPPYAQRAFNTVLNGGENFGFFAAAVILQIVVRGPTNGTAEMALLSLVHFGARVVQGLAYIVGFSTLRTMAFVVASVANVALYVLLLEKIQLS